MAVQYLAPIPEVERGDLMSAYYRRLTGNDDKVKQECATAWSVWYLSLPPGPRRSPMRLRQHRKREVANGPRPNDAHMHTTYGLGVTGR
jgi:hypothetical protein